MGFDFGDFVRVLVGIGGIRVVVGLQVFSVLGSWGLISWCLEVHELLGKMLVECYYAWEGTKGR